jgi:hypothetical protein
MSVFLKDGRKLALHQVFEIEMNVDLDLLSVSDLARRIYFDDRAPCAESREDPTPVVPSQYMHETCRIIFSIGSN